jgi:Type II secretion system (T2SS), protein G
MMRRTARKYAYLAVIVLVALIGILEYGAVERPSSPLMITNRHLLQLHRYCINYKVRHGAFPREGSWSKDIVLDSIPDKDLLDVDLTDVMEVFYDGWKRVLHYRCPGKHNPNGFDLYSVGPNGIDEGGGGDDIGNWGARFKNEWPRTIVVRARVGPSSAGTGTVDVLLACGCRCPKK